MPGIILNILFQLYSEEKNHVNVYTVVPSAPVKIQGNINQIEDHKIPK